MRSEFSVDSSKNDEKLTTKGTLASASSTFNALGNVNCGLTL